MRICLTTARAQRYVAGVVVGLLCVAFAGAAEAQEPAADLLDKLSARSTVHWRAAPGRQAIERLATETQTPVWVDRRVDTRKELTLAAGDQSVARLLDDVATALGVGVAAVDNVVYVGPPDSAAALPTLAAQWRRGAPSALRERSVLRWPRLTEPRTLAAEIASSAGFRIENSESIPHDLWAAGATPPLAAGDQLTLLCLGFDLRWAVAERGQKTIRLEPIDEAPSRTPKTLASLIGSKPAPAGETRYTLRVVEQPIGPVLRQLAERLGLEFEVAVDPGALQGRVSFEVRQATLDELLEAAGDAAALDIHATDAAVVVRPRE